MGILTTIADFIINNLAHLVAIAAAVVAITPTDSDDKVFGRIKNLLKKIFPNKIK